MANFIGIYKITSPSGRIYIGQSWDVNKRFKTYKNLQCKGQTLLYKSLSKYGVENHIFEMIHELPKDVEQSILDTYEILYISQYNSNYIRSGFGLNLTDGGDKGTKGHKHSQESKEKMRLAKIGNKCRLGTGEYKVKQRYKRGSVEAIQKQMKSKIGVERVIEIYNRFTNQLVDTCNFSIQAEELTGVNSKNIQQNLRGANKRAGDFIFKYKIL